MRSQKRGSGEKHQDGRPVPFGFFVIIVYRLTELCILNAENVEKVYGLLFKQTSWPNKDDLVSELWFVRIVLLCDLRMR